VKNRFRSEFSLQIFAISFFFECSLKLTKKLNAVQEEKISEKTSLSEFSKVVKTDFLKVSVC